MTKFKKNSILFLSVAPVFAFVNTLEKGIVISICMLATASFMGIIYKLIHRLPKGLIYLVSGIFLGCLLTGINFIFHNYLQAFYPDLAIAFTFLAILYLLGQKETQAIASVKKLFLETLKYAFLVCFIAAICEILGTNTLTVMDVTRTITGYIDIHHFSLPTNLFPMSIFENITGAYFILAILLAIFNRKGEKQDESVD